MPMIKCRVSPFMPTYDLRRAVGAALWDAGFEEEAGRYFVKTELARSPDEAIRSDVLPPMIELDWGVPEPALAVGAP